MSLEENISVLSEEVYNQRVALRSLMERVEKLEKLMGDSLDMHGRILSREERFNERLFRLEERRL